jgi:hypothetical protein
MAHSFNRPTAGALGAAPWAFTKRPQCSLTLPGCSLEFCSWPAKDMLSSSRAARRSPQWRPPRSSSVEPPLLKRRSCDDSLVGAGLVENMRSLGLSECCVHPVGGHHKQPSGSDRKVSQSPRWQNLADLVPPTKDSNNSPWTASRSDTSSRQRLGDNFICLSGGSGPTSAMGLFACKGGLEAESALGSEVRDG